MFTAGVQDLSPRGRSTFISVPTVSSLGTLESHTQAIKCANPQTKHSLVFTGQREFPSLPDNKGAGKTRFAPS